MGNRWTTVDGFYVQFSIPFYLNSYCESFVYSKQTHTNTHILTLTYSHTIHLHFKREINRNKNAHK